MSRPPGPMERMETAGGGGAPASDAALSHATVSDATGGGLDAQAAAAARVAIELLWPGGADAPPEQQLLRAAADWLAGSPDPSLGPMCAQLSHLGHVLRLTAGHLWTDKPPSDRKPPKLKDLLTGPLSRGGMFTVADAVPTTAAVHDGGGSGDGGGAAAAPRPCVWLNAALPRFRSTQTQGLRRLISAVFPPPDRAAAATAAGDGPSSDTDDGGGSGSGAAAAVEMRRLIAYWLSTSPEPAVGAAAARLTTLSLHLRTGPPARLWLSPEHTWPRLKKFLLDPESRGLEAAVAPLLVPTSMSAATPGRPQPAAAAAAAPAAPAAAGGGRAAQALLKQLASEHPDVFSSCSELDGWAVCGKGRSHAVLRLASPALLRLLAVTAVAAAEGAPPSGGAAAGEDLAAATTVVAADAALAAPHDPWVAADCAPFLPAIDYDGHDSMITTAPPPVATTSPRIAAALRLLDRHLLKAFSASAGDGAATATAAALRCVARMLATAPPPHELSLAALGAEVPKQLLASCGLRFTGRLLPLCQHRPDVFAVRTQGKSHVVVRLVSPGLLGLAAAVEAALAEAAANSSAVGAGLDTAAAEADGTGGVGAQSPPRPETKALSTDVEMSDAFPAGAEGSLAQPERGFVFESEYLSAEEIVAVQSAVKMPIPVPVPMPTVPADSAYPYGSGANLDLDSLLCLSDPAGTVDGWNRSMLAGAALHVIADPHGPALPAALQHCHAASHIGLSVQSYGRVTYIVTLYAPQTAAAGGGGGSEGGLTLPAAVYVLDCTACEQMYGGSGPAAVASLLGSLRGLLEAPGVAKVVHGCEQPNPDLT
ncbi:hypothetical protein GPECTOR_573g616 [Gonium pectorale]|uniref:Uncharacterized protein n=1 Tax=Gonium pectorale TaxID=33097 RepID=A0A150FUL7_GONPE|nr:hypothetical protein GPECTOR_573g616 [Gonium pectorale]|eukprot:KXZ41292.1 hypothetical protein GPECTOR_573g616 [Gonium pectorale]